MNIEMKYWMWDESLNQSIYKLGHQASELVNRKLVEKSPDGNYLITSDYPWKIEVQDDLICSVFYRDFFFTFSRFNLELWDLPINEFILTVNQVLSPTEEKFTGDKLVVVFKDGFVAIAGIKREY